MDKKFSRLIEPGFRFYFLVLLIFSAASTFFSVKLALIQFCSAVLIYLFYRRENVRRRRKIVKYVESLTYNVNDVTKTSVLNYPLPMMILDAVSEEILWCNDNFHTVTGNRDQVFGNKVSEVIPGFDARWVIEGKTVYPRGVTIGDKIFDVHGNLFRPHSSVNGRGMLSTLFFIDKTDYERLKKEHAEIRPVISIIMIDNYEELLKNSTDKEKSQILAEIDNVVTTWATPADGVLRKFDRDRYLFIFEEKAMESFLNDKFQILDKVRAIQSREGITATLSIGIGCDGAHLSENLGFASLAIDMALSRGGDQAVIKNRFSFEFFGGQVQTPEKRTKVRSRVMANSFVQIIKDSKKVYIMGHKVSDIDSVGSSCGIVCLARKLNIPAFIVADTDETSAQPLITRLKGIPEYREVFITPEDAILYSDSSTLLIVMDTNKPDYVESPQLLSAVNRVAVIDHHRRSANYIDKCVINFHEPYSSSSAELVTELLQYTVTPQEILRVEAEALLGGIVLDSKWFTIRTGVRTFEAAAYLRRIGADTVEVKKMFQSDLIEYKLRHDLASNVEIYRGDAAIAVYGGNADRAVAAQAADDLLSISGIRASFVVLNDEDTVVISARSLGQVNVQFIMEKLGGGGNLTTAGAQLYGAQIEGAVQRLRDAYDSYLEERKER
ncbi:MAG: DHH family phosphoesterase [Bacillota bacterium]|nr:DHH family phosphoesterase [Bacillota bacterium]